MIRGQQQVLVVYVSVNIFFKNCFVYCGQYCEQKYQHFYAAAIPNGIPLKLIGSIFFLLYRCKFVHKYLCIKVCYSKKN